MLRPGPAHALALLPFVLFAPLTAGVKVFASQDLQAYFFPYHVLFARLLGEGHWPFWNPYVFCGIPLFGDGQTAMLYPPNWLFFLIPAPVALNLVVLMQFSLAGAGMYLFGRALGQSRLPALTAGLSYMFCGFLTARVVHLSIMSGAAMIPWIFLCADRLIERGGRRWFVVTSVALAIQAVAGHPQLPIYTAIGLLLYAVVRGLQHRERLWHLLRPATLISAAYLAGYSLAAIQLVPWFEVASLSNRAAGTTRQFVFSTSTQGAEWLLFLFPHLLGAHASSPFSTTRLDIERAVRIWEHSAYVGVLPLALAAVAIGYLAELTWLRFGRGVSRRPDLRDPAVELRRRYSLAYLAILLAVGLLIAAGWHTPFGRVLYGIPVIGKLRAVERALVLASFALAVLAGFGFQRAIEWRAKTGWLLIPAVLVLAIPVFVIWQLEELTLESPPAVLPLLFAVSSSLLLAWWSRRPATLATGILAVSVVVLDMAIYAVTFTPTASAKLYAYRPAVLDALRGSDEPFRKATVLAGTNDLDIRVAQDSLTMSWGMVYGVEDVNGFNSLQPRRYTDYLFGRAAIDVSYGYLSDRRLFDARNPVLNSLNVRYVFVPQGVQMPAAPHLRLIFQTAHVSVYKNPLAYPRAYLVERVENERDSLTVLRRVKARRFDGRRRAIVESPAAPRLPRARHDAHAKVSRSGPNQMQVETTTAEPRFLVVSEMYFPGWKAYVDGVATEIYRTNYLFRGVVVPPGRHTITFLYRPRSVVMGAVISTLAVIVLAAVLASDLRKSS